MNKFKTTQLFGKWGTLTPFTKDIHATSLSYTSNKTINFNKEMSSTDFKLHVVHNLYFKVA